MIYKSIKNNNKRVKNKSVKNKSVKNKRIKNKSIKNKRVKNKSIKKLTKKIYKGGNLDNKILKYCDHIDTNDLILSVDSNYIRDYGDFLNLFCLIKNKKKLVAFNYTENYRKAIKVSGNIDKINNLIGQAKEKKIRAYHIEPSNTSSMVLDDMNKNKYSVFYRRNNGKSARCYMALLWAEELVKNYLKSTYIDFSVQSLYNVLKVYWILKLENYIDKDIISFIFKIFNIQLNNVDRKIFDILLYYFNPSLDELRKVNPDITFIKKLKLI